jgi:hypothetical protein
VEISDYLQLYILPSLKQGQFIFPKLQKIENFRYAFCGFYQLYQLPLFLKKITIKAALTTPDKYLLFPVKRADS